MSDFAGGDGSESNPYQIEDWNHLDNVREYGVEGGSNYSSGNYFILNNNLDKDKDGYSSLVDTSDGWDSIGNYSNRFKGYFNGKGYEIKDLYIYRPSTDYVGLFGYIDYSDSVIKRFSVTNGDIEGNVGVGLAIATIENGESVKNIYTTGSVVGNDNNVGGVIGTNVYAILENLYSTADVSDGGSGVSSIGGVVGQQQDVIIDSMGLDSASDSVIGNAFGTQEGRVTLAPQSDMQSIGLYNDDSYGTYDALYEAWDIVTENSDFTKTWFIDDGKDYPYLNANMGVDDGVYKYNDTDGDWESIEWNSWNVKRGIGRNILAPKGELGLGKHVKINANDRIGIIWHDYLVIDGLTKSKGEIDEEGFRDVILRHKIYKLMKNDKIHHDFSKDYINPFDKQDESAKEMKFMKGKNIDNIVIGKGTDSSGNECIARLNRDTLEYDWVKNRTLIGDVGIFMNDSINYDACYVTLSAGSDTHDSEIRIVAYDYDGTEKWKLTEPTVVDTKPICAVTDNKVYMLAMDYYYNQIEIFCYEYDASTSDNIERIEVNDLYDVVGLMGGNYICYLLKDNNDNININYWNEDIGSGSGDIATPSLDSFNRSTVEWRLFSIHSNTIKLRKFDDSDETETVLDTITLDSNIRDMKQTSNGDYVHVITAYGTYYEIKMDSNNAFGEIEKEFSLDEEYDYMTHINDTYKSFLSNSKPKTSRYGKVESTTSKYTFEDIHLKDFLEVIFNETTYNVVYNLPDITIDKYHLEDRTRGDIVKDVLEEAHCVMRIDGEDVIFEEIEGRDYLGSYNTADDDVNVYDWEEENLDSIANKIVINATGNREVETQFIYKDQSSIDQYGERKEEYNFDWLEKESDVDRLKDDLLVPEPLCDGKLMFTGQEYMVEDICNRSGDVTDDSKDIDAGVLIEKMYITPSEVECTVGGVGNAVTPSIGTKTRAEHKKKLDKKSDRDKNRHGADHTKEHEDLTLGAGDVDNLYLTSTEPSDPTNEDIWIDTGSNEIKIWDDYNKVWNIVASH